MNALVSPLFSSDARSDWLRLQTFTMLRWVAIVGQTVAITIAVVCFDLHLDLGPVFAVVGAAVIANLVSVAIYPAGKRLSEPQALAMLLFDLAQLAALIWLTGGLHNPFALLLVAPVTISATALRLRSTIVLCAAVVFCTSVLAVHHVPLRTAQGLILSIPDIFLFGFWIAIVIGAVFLGVYARRVTSEIHSMSEALLATQMALSREQKLTDLSGVAAAAAHELGTPLATIKLVSSELIEELSSRSDLRGDAELIREQADRCREILRSMGRAGKDDAHLRTAPLSAVLREAAEQHTGRGRQVIFDCRPGDGAGAGAEPEILRQPELVHGIRNLVQNAVDFAAARVWVEAEWSAEQIRVRITDDGPGYAAHVIRRIGEPFVRRRRGAGDRGRRPEYEGMGLGLFIAKTLLERTGAGLSFANGSVAGAPEHDRPEKCGAVVEVVWPRNGGGSGPEVTVPRRPLGENRPIVA